MHDKAIADTQFYTGLAYHAAGKDVVAREEYMYALETREHLFGTVTASTYMSIGSLL